MRKKKKQPKFNLDPVDGPNILLLKEREKKKIPSRRKLVSANQSPHKQFLEKKNKKKSTCHRLGN